MLIRVGRLDARLRRVPSVPSTQHCRIVLFPLVYFMILVRTLEEALCCHFIFRHLVRVSAARDLKRIDKRLVFSGSNALCSNLKTVL